MSSAGTNTAPPAGAKSGADSADGGASKLSSSSNPSHSLYVGDLLPEVTEAELYEMFSRLGPVVSIKICRDIITRRSLGYAYINFQQPDDAQRALEELNFVEVRGQQMRIMYSQRDPASRKSGVGNIFVKNLDKSITSGDLYNTFGQFGPIASCKIATDSVGNPKGYGFVQFEKQEAADEAIARVNNMVVAGRQVYVGPFVRRQDRGNGESKFSNVYVKNISENCTEDDLKEIFGKHGEITSVVIMRDSEGKSKEFGFVNFEAPESAKSAVEELNGFTHDGKSWVVNKAQRKSEREAELRKEREQTKSEKFNGCNLYVKNLDDAIGDDELRTIFQELGSITSCKVMKDESGNSKGLGFVAFSSPEEATRAISEMNGKMTPPCKKPLYVALAQRKEDRQARLKAQFQAHQMGGPMGGVMHPGMAPMFPGQPGMSPQAMMFPGGPGGMMPPGGMGYGAPPGIPGMMPGMRPGMQGMPFYSMPMMQPQGGAGMPGQGRGRGRGVRNNQPPMQPGRGGRGGMKTMEKPHSMAPAPPTSVPASPSSVLAQQLQTCTPENRRVILGEALYPLISAIEPAAAAKVTGMLLEMDQSEVILLIESPADLQLKVGEAIKVLKEAGQDPHLEQLAAEAASTDAVQEGVSAMTIST
mmetsp:Transcript_2134/g.6316  ORF Transcript_2134/g.6316 Transcript_2134/m.6316 type:complete len:644 (-) Transcript_2134:300-2231(-)|eukprot:CAMPEP_0117674368 /NCGR_PEP_ID=MMETSP0804-20121206/14997_1 /TAXON_ID=1074897 /ORGANISM="Tetraselmis astigmatica, Strain CCMP880" /LENGTH=643 /DNA_ID=CAMNT_0005483225 /DNA_START=340 /DNA_END=2271 /DNA_ORIENTATION=-